MQSRKFLYYFFSLCLCFWYFSICWLAYYPDVSNEYRLFFIERKLKTWPGLSGK